MTATGSEAAGGELGLGRVIAAAILAQRVECRDHPPGLPKPSCWACGRNGAFTRAARIALGRHHADPGDACRGRSWEHHDETELLPGGWWRCLTCGDGGDLRGMSAVLVGLRGDVERLRRWLWGARLAVLLPSDAPPRQLGTFLGADVYRVQGLPWPCVTVVPPTASLDQVFQPARPAGEAAGHEGLPVAPFR